MDESQKLAAADAQFAATTIAKLVGFLHAAQITDDTARSFVENSIKSHYPKSVPELAGRRDELLGYLVGGSNSSGEG